MDNVNGHPYPCDLADQDFVHCGKKLVNHLKHYSHVLTDGGNMIHISQFKYIIVLDIFHPLEHGLQQGDIERQARMNWESAQRLDMFLKVRTCLEQMDAGTAPGNIYENVKGTIMFLDLCWVFIEIFLSLFASLLTLVKYASCVVNILRIWRL